MKKIIYILVILLGFLVCTGCEKNTYNKEQRNPTTLLEAWNIAEKEAKDWSNDVVVISVNSTDYLDNEDIQNGINGKRKCWAFAFHSEEKGKQYHMYVVDNEVYAAQETTISVYKGIEKIDMDSEDAYKIAVEYGISGGIDWAYGYHYLLQYYFINGNENEPVLSLVVRGISSKSNNEMMLYLNPYTQEIIQCLEKISYDENGRSVWERVDNSSTFNDSTGDVSEKIWTREEIQKEYKVFELAKKYYMDPEELTDAIWEGIHSDRFDPFANTKTYAKEEWERIMTERYGDVWITW